MTAHLDRTDLKILAALQDNARITNLALSELVALSASACLSRVRRLRKAGFIDRDLSLLAPSKLGPVIHAFIEISLSNHKVADYRTFEAGIRNVKEATMAVKVSGRYDYLLAVTTTDMSALNQLSDDLFEGGLGISKVVTVPILDVAKPFSGFPVELLARP